MISCHQCRGASAALNAHGMCLRGQQLTVSAAAEFDAILALKKMAHKDPAGFVYACPDVSAHGQAYALAAEPLTVTGYQEGLF